MRAAGAFALSVWACAAGSRDTLDTSSHAVVSDASTRPGAYAYVARRGAVALGLAASRGMGEEETHQVVDRIADQASACFQRSAQVTPGAARIELPIDEGGTTGTPVTTFSPPGSVALGMVCVLAPMRLMTFAPGSARSITIEAAWGNDVTP